MSHSLGDNFLPLIPHSFFYFNLLDLIQPNFINLLGNCVPGKLLVASFKILTILSNMFGSRVTLESFVNTISGKCKQIHTFYWDKIKEENMPVSIEYREMLSLHGTREDLSSKQAWRK